MKLKLGSFSFLVVLSMLSAPLLRAQENPSDDSDLAKDDERSAGHAERSRRSAKEEPARLKKENGRDAGGRAEGSRAHGGAGGKEKEALQAALKKQVAEPGHDSLPDWTPKTPNFTATGPVVKKIVDDEVKIIQTGSSALSPKDLGDNWEAAAEATGKLNRSRNNIKSNDTVTVILFLSTRESPQEKVEMEAKREPEDKVTHIEISSPLPKPEIPSAD